MVSYNPNGYRPDITRANKFWKIAEIKLCWLGKRKGQTGGWPGRRAHWLAALGRGAGRLLSAASLSTEHLGFLSYTWSSDIKVNKRKQIVGPQKS